MSTEPSPANPVTPFLVPEALKDNLGISHSDRDSQINGIVFNANVEIEKILLPFADEIPVRQGTRLFVYGKSLALLYAKARFRRETGQLKRYEKIIEEFKEEKQSVIDTLKAERNTRTRRVSVGTDYRTRRLFSQVKRY